MRRFCIVYGLFISESNQYVIIVLFNNQERKLLYIQLCKARNKQIFNGKANQNRIVSFRLMGFKRPRVQISPPRPKPLKVSDFRRFSIFGVSDCTLDFERNFYESGVQQNDKNQDEIERFG